MLDGLYLRVDDIDRRPAYNRSDGEPIVLKYSNTRLVDPEVLLFSLHGIRQHDRLIWLYESFKQVKYNVGFESFHHVFSQPK